MRVTVDADLCGGHGACVEACPEVFRIGTDGWSEVLVDAVPPGLEVAVQRAHDECPTRAILVTADQE